jgi:hypothetical protein
VPLNDDTISRRGGGCLEKVQVYASTIFSVLAQKIAGCDYKTVYHEGAFAVFFTHSIPQSLMQFLTFTPIGEINM